MEANDLKKKIYDFNGLVVEIGGPTINGYEFLKDLNIDLPRKIIVTNIKNPITINPFGDNPKEYKVDMVADINNLPFDDNSIDIIMASSLPHKLHEQLFRESKRVLKSNGLVIAENIKNIDIKYAKENGFQVSKLHNQQYSIFNGIFIKN